MIPYFVTVYCVEGGQVDIINNVGNDIDDVKFKIAQILLNKSADSYHLYYTTNIVKKLFKNDETLHMDVQFSNHDTLTFKYGYWYNNEWVNNISYEELTKYFNSIMFNFIKNDIQFKSNSQNDELIINTLEEAQNEIFNWKNSIKLTNWKDTYEINYTEVFDENNPKVIEVKKRV